MSKNIKKLLILNIPYLVLGLLFNKLPEAWRYTNGADLGQKILNLGIGFSKAFAVAFPSFYPTDLLIGLAIGGLLRLVIYARSKNAKKYRKDVEYGSGSGKTRFWLKPNLMQCPSSFHIGCHRPQRQYRY